MRNQDSDHAATVPVHQLKMDKNGEFEFHCKYAAAACVFVRTLQLDSQYRTHEGEDLSNNMPIALHERTFNIY